MEKTKTKHVQVSVLVVLLSLCVVLITGTQQNENQQTARDIAEQFTEMMERRTLETEDKYATRPKSERMARSHNRLSKRYKQKLEESRKRHLERNVMALMALGEKQSDVVLRELETLERLKRADIDPNCDEEITCNDSEIYRTANGTCNNLDNPLWGSAGIQHLRLLPNAYRNGIWVERQRSVTSGRGTVVELPTARDISNAVHRYDGEDDGTDTPVSDDVSHMLWAWGQFLAHDIVETPEGEVRASVNCCDSDTGNSQFCMPIEIDAEDTYYTGGVCMPAVRSFTVLPCDDDFQNQINDLTSYIDASNVYGSDESETAELRSFTGGFLKTSTNNFPPNDTSEDPICDRQETKYCAKSEVRANVIPSLTTLHTVFVREHNRIADYLNDINPGWSDETVFQETRKIVAAEMQHITYNQFLPTMLSDDIMTDYRLNTPSENYVYESDTDASAIQAFSIAFRGHSMIPPSMKFFNTEYETVDGVISTTNTYLHPHYLFWNNYGAIDEIARWVVGDKCPMADRYMESTARNELFLDDGVGYDLAALNIQRGREWGTPSYTEYRSFCGLADDVDDWDWNALTDHEDDAIIALQSVYADPEDIDLYTGIVTENKLEDSLMGPTGSCLIAMQFEALKYGDRFWYETTETSSEGVSLGFTSEQLEQLQKVSLSKILCDNLDIPYIQENAFHLGDGLFACDDIEAMELDKWSAATKK